MDIYKIIRLLPYAWPFIKELLERHGNDAAKRSGNGGRVILLLTIIVVIFGDTIVAYMEDNDISEIIQECDCNEENIKIEELINKNKELIRINGEQSRNIDNLRYEIELLLDMSKSNDDIPIGTCDSVDSDHSKVEERLDDMRVKEEFADEKN